jgi:hypothetical protein
MIAPGKNEKNAAKYRRLSPVYDWAARNPLFERPRARLFELAAIQPTDRVLVVGVGTASCRCNSAPAWSCAARSIPDRHDLFLGQAVPLEEGAGGVRPVDLEALVLGAMALDQAHVVNIART